MSLILIILFFTNLYILFQLKEKKIMSRFENLFVSSYFDLGYSIFVSFCFFCFFFCFLRVYKFIIPQNEYVDLFYYYHIISGIFFSLTVYQKFTGVLLLFIIIVFLKKFREIVFKYFKYHFLRVHYFFRFYFLYKSFFSLIVSFESNIKFRLKSRYVYYFFIRNNGFRLFIFCYLIYFIFFSNTALFYIGFLKYYALYYFFLRFLNFLPFFCSDFDDGMTSFYSPNLCITSTGFHKLNLYGKYLVCGHSEYYFCLSVVYNFNFKYPKNWIFYSCVKNIF